MIIKRGIIEAFQGSWNSGIASLIISGQLVYCENTSTVRAFDNCFGNVITEGHCFNPKAVIGKDIVYSMDEMGLLFEAFTPTKEWRKMYGRKNTPILGEELEIDPKNLEEVR